MAENSRKNEFFERESIAIIAITTSNSIKVNACAGDKENFFSREKKFSLSPAPPFSFKKSGTFCSAILRTFPYSSEKNSLRFIFSPFCFITDILFVTDTLTFYQRRAHISHPAVDHIASFDIIDYLFGGLG